VVKFWKEEGPNRLRIILMPFSDHLRSHHTGLFPGHRLNQGFLSRTADGAGPAVTFSVLTRETKCLSEFWRQDTTLVTCRRHVGDISI